MQPRRFDLLTRSFSVLRSRRQALRGVAAVLSPTALALMAGDAASKRKKRKKKKKKNKPSGSDLLLNGFGCVDFGNPCLGNGANCCSGLCAGPAPEPGQPDTSSCAAHDIDVCQADDDVCGGAFLACGDPGMACFRTTGKASYCGSFISYKCETCRKDTDCEALGYLPGSACVVCEDGCSMTACVPPNA